MIAIYQAWRPWRDLREHVDGKNKVVQRNDLVLVAGMYYWKRNVVTYFKKLIFDGGGKKKTLDL